MFKIKIIVNISTSVMWSETVGKHSSSSNERRVVNVWYKLPQHVTYGYDYAPSVKSFKNRLDNLWKDMDVTSCIA